ncbi:extracellular solute-binding protein [Pelagovum pacificum]|uniref:Extracellular solute-binding protein n=1 Tax=Pelagovum pacificum TaxID=2588711 RepID=A0A5C5GHA0_9RHOB|nr:extracellular solute-binding protein [Pelagovum pacificum]QQA42707.1 extracellular solute-binding protein [Pelagovum pacificum]TNY34142.1 extracellular solute-binding protein [Pelagovum pacificum]
MKNSILGISGASCIAALMAVATPASAQSIDFWTLFTGPDGEAISDMVAEFNESAGADADVEVNLLVIPWDDFNTKLSVSMASGQAPALTIVNSDRVPIYANQGALEAFTAEELETAGINKDDYIAASWDAGMFEGEQYGVPLGMFPRHIYYNKALFEQAGLDPESPPTTGEEVLAAAEAIEALGDDVHGMIFAKSGSGAFRDFYSRYWQYNPDLYNEDMTDVSDGFEEAATNVLNDIQAMIDADVSPENEVDDPGQLFAQNKVGIVFSQITDLNLYKAAAENQGVEYGVAPFPVYGNEPATFAMAHEFLIPRGASAEDRAAALTFIEWVGARGFEWAMTGKVPSQLAVFEEERFQAEEDLVTIADIRDTIHFPPSIVAQPDVDRVVREAMEAFYAGRADVDQTVQNLVRGIASEL